MANFTRAALEDAARNNTRLGGWNGKSVYACSKKEYNPDWTYNYIIYDDYNTLVCNGKAYGTVSLNGSVDEFKGGPQTYRPFKAEKKKKEEAQPQTSDYFTVGEGYSTEALPDDIFDIIGQGVDELLRDACASDWES